jgi:hypothetical protein
VSPAFATIAVSPIAAATLTAIRQSSPTTKSHANRPNALTRLN